MMRRLLLSCVLLAGAAAAEDLRLSAGEIENLGIRTVIPERTSDVAATGATARVALPPAGDAILSTSQAGIVGNVSVSAGDAVTAGQVVAELQSAGFLELQRAYVDAVNARRLAVSDVERDRELRAEGIISARRLQETEARGRVTVAVLDEHRQLLRIAGLDEATLRTLETGGRLVPVLQIRSPFAGVIAERYATTGEHVEAMTPLFRLLDLSELWLEIDVPQERVAAVRPGMRVTGPDGDFAGEVRAVGRTIDEHTQAVRVRATVTEGADTLLPGQFVAVNFLAGGDAADTLAWAVPSVSLTRHGDEHYLFVRSAAGFEVRRVELLGISGERAWVHGDLDAADRIAASGIPALKAIWFAASETES
jgi:membrane fusion protein, heavy metal efflux system